MDIGVPKKRILSLKMLMFIRLLPKRQMDYNFNLV